MSLLCARRILCSVLSAPQAAYHATCLQLSSAGNPACGAAHTVLQGGLRAEDGLDGCLQDESTAMQGLWGPGSPFTDFKAFLDSMKSRGVSFLEMLAMEMKSEGYYVARGLSFT